MGIELVIVVDSLCEHAKCPSESIPLKIKAPASPSVPVTSNSKSAV